MYNFLIATAVTLYSITLFKIINNDYMKTDNTTFILYALGTVALVGAGICRNNEQIKH